MNQHNNGALLPRIVLVSGSPGTGKTSLSKLLAENARSDRAVHIHTDDFYQYIRKGYISPWLDGSGDQNATMVKAVAASARQYCLGGYEVFVDGVIGPWFLEPWIGLAQEGIDVRYIVLRPSVQATVSRVVNREQNEFFPLSESVVTNLWLSLADLGEFEPHAIDTTAQTERESADLILNMLDGEAFRIPGHIKE